MQTTTPFSSPSTDRALDTGGVGAALGLLVLGQAIAGASIAVFGQPSGNDTAAVPAWVFPAVWVLLYPCLAIGLLEARRATAGTLAGRLLGPWMMAALVVNLSWVPISTAAQEPWVSVLLDVVGTASIWCLAAGVRSAAPQALRWFVPLLVWTPITSALSLGAALA